MFTELYEVARHTPLQISVSPEGARLNVLIIPKPGDDTDETSALAKPIQAIGTPEELDRELPAKLAEYCAAINDLRLKIDMPIEAITAEAGSGGRTKKKASTPTRTPARASAPTPKKKVAPRPVKKAAAIKPARPVKHTPAAPKAAATQVMDTPAPALDRETPAARPTPASAAAAFIKPEAHAKKSKRATREECLADLRAYVAQRESGGLAITRALFIEHNSTGRSYERKFSSWDKFLFEAKNADTNQSGSQTAAAPAQSGNADADAHQSSTDAPPATTTLSKTTINPALKWPFPEKHVNRTIYTGEGKLLGTSAEALHMHDPYTHPQLGTFRVIEVEYLEDSSERITVEPWSDGVLSTGPAAAESTAAKPRLKHTSNGAVYADTGKPTSDANPTAPLFPE